DPVVIDEGVLTRVTGTAEAFATVTLTIGSTAVTLTADEDGLWAHDVVNGTGLTDNVVLSATAVDRVGNTASAARDLGGLHVTGRPNAPSSGLTVSEAGLTNGTAAGSGQDKVAAVMQLLKPGNTVESVTFGDS